MIILNWLKQTPLWLVLPSVFLAAGVATAVVHYEPLAFDPSLYEVQTARAAELETIDAEAIEAANVADAAPADVKLDAPVVAAGGALADGSWTGYAPCGQNNPDKWKPYYIGVVVNVKGGEVRGISRIFGSSTGNAGDPALSWDADENQKYLDWAISGRNGDAGVRSQLSGPAVASRVDTVSGATYSSAAIFNAYVDAISKASRAAGGKVTAPAKVKAQVKKKKATKLKANDEMKVGVLVDGSWTGYAQCGPDPDDDWKPYYIGVVLTVSGGKVATIDKIFGSSEGEEGSAALVYDEGENKQYLDAAVYGVGTQLEKAAAQGRVLGGIDTVSGATFSSRAMYEAYYAALQKSAAAAGSSVVVSEDAGNAAPKSVADVADEEVTAGAETAPENTYYGYAYCSSSGSDSWAPYYLFVQVNAENGQVKNVVRAYGDADGIVDPNVLYSASENSLYLNWAIDGKFGGTGYRMKSVIVQIQEKIEAGLQVNGISTVSGATRSSRSLIEAYEMAAVNAAADRGHTPEEAVRVQAEIAAGNQSDPEDQPDSENQPDPEDQPDSEDNPAGETGDNPSDETLVPGTPIF